MRCGVHAVGHLSPQETHAHTPTSLVTAAQIARLTGVTGVSRATASNWRRRHREVAELLARLDLTTNS